MRTHIRTSDLMKKVVSLMTDNHYEKAGDIAKTCHVALSTVYRIIRLMREGDTFSKRKPLGIHSTKDGYVLSEYAKQKDDVNFLRRLNGRRVSDYIAIKAAEPHIRNRWTAIPGGARQLSMILGPLTPNANALNQGMKILVKKAVS